MTQQPQAGGRVVVIGVGNEFRHDDGVGPMVIDRLRAVLPADIELLVSDGEPASMIEAWNGASLAVVVDAVVAEHAHPGRLHRLVLDQVAGADVRQVSSHGLGLGEAIGLARALDRLPSHLIVHAVEAADTSQGVGLTAPVAAAVDAMVSVVLADLEQYRHGSPLSQGPH